MIINFTISTCLLSVIAEIVFITLLFFLISFSFGVAGAILAESGLSFLGLGVNPPNMSWGSLLSDGKAVIDIAWWVSFFPGLMIFLTTYSLALYSNDLQNRINKRDVIA